MSAENESTIVVYNYLAGYSCGYSNQFSSLDEAEKWESMGQAMDFIAKQYAEGSVCAISYFQASELEKVRRETRCKSSSIYIPDSREKHFLGIRIKDKAGYSIVLKTQAALFLTEFQLRSQPDRKFEVLTDLVVKTASLLSGLINFESGTSNLKKIFSCVLELRSLDVRTAVLAQTFRLYLESDTKSIRDCVPLAFHQLGVPNSSFTQEQELE